ncbi:uncharacterized protein SPPG_05351 [Spizellomyces punctatus DAOM BR117]|uniref:CBM21 domain-containing protein n=1 Tax=Spizellomyces punctatus (strain DAOM BR117) TaxID=645134 RepID=A0A0L0HG18_SPIPD|nr:uncharacterized protein SPPG_05351 [Spizellomyces punctatus DAOM BR117]KNC99976.1 hypothetical protein SPPG_05351 [Spizellomyces punctatus DAOM BR117]|eukprot:XP_016608016.1 hypothetical protein SPPG_05351 [Spizellomyces punctatus DAOM BR117]
MLYTADTYSPIGSPLPVQANRPTPADVHRILQRVQPRATDCPAGARSLLSRSPPSNSLGFKKPTAPQYELVRKVPSPPGTPAPKPTSPVVSARSPVRNSKGDIVPSCLKSTPAARLTPRTTTTSLTRPANGLSEPTTATEKKSITFGQTLEYVCLFARGSLASDINGFEQYGVQDTGDVDAGSLSASLALRETWVIANKNSPAIPSFGAQPLVLDNIHLEEGRIVTGNVLVRNLDFGKTVVIRYTIDGWTSTNDIKAVFANIVSQSTIDFCGMDRFVFKIDLNREFGTSAVKGKVDFAIRYDVKGESFWDNNGGQNYTVELSRPTHQQVGLSTSAGESRPGYTWERPVPNRARAARNVRPSPPPAAPVLIPSHICSAAAVNPDVSPAPFIPVAPPTGVAATTYMSLPMTPAQRRESRRAVALAKTSTLADPNAKYSPPAAESVPIPINATRRSPSPTSFSDAIEMPFSTSPLEAMAQVGRQVYRGSRLYADSDSFGIPSLGCSPPSAFAACRA